MVDEPGRVLVFFFSFFSSITGCKQKKYKYDTQNLFSANFVLVNWNGNFVKLDKMQFIYQISQSEISMNNIHSYHVFVQTD